MDPIRVELSGDDIYQAIIAQARLYSSLDSRFPNQDFDVRINLRFAEDTGAMAATVSFMAIDTPPTHEITFK